MSFDLIRNRPHLARQEAVEEPIWLSMGVFEADTTASEKVARVGNQAIAATSLLGCYTIATGGVGFFSYLAYPACALTARKVTATILGYFTYPSAAAFLVKYLPEDTRITKIIPSFLANQYKQLVSTARELVNQCEQRGNEIHELEQEGFRVESISIRKSGTEYDALLITHPKTMDNSNWTLHALGNAMVMENQIYTLAKENYSNQCNTLLINGPSVNKSRGWPTRYQMGAAFEAGLQLLEKEIQAMHIVMRGFSLGGGMMAEAVLQHDFEEGRRKGVS